jgi:trk system potassium uptake protein
VTSAESLPVPQMLALRKVVGARTPAALRRQLWAIIGFTAVVETAGAACLYVCLPAEQEPQAKLWWSLFHAVSAFCNAGFALSAGSLTTFQDHPGAMLTFMGLIVLGGLGFLVVTDLLGLQISRLPFVRSIPWVGRYNQRVAVYRLPIQTRLSVIVTCILIALGLAGFWALEASNVLVNKPLLTQFLISSFQSVTARTAGFNTVPIDQLRPATLLLIMVLMVVGACPVSTGITAQVSPGSQLILCVLMFTGRVGPISLVLSVVRTQRIARYQFPEEDLVMG